MAGGHRCCSLALQAGADAVGRAVSSTLSLLLLQVATAAFSMNVAPGHNTRGRLNTLCAVVFSLIPSLDCQVTLMLLGYGVLATAGYSMLLLTSKSCTYEPTIPRLYKFIQIQEVGSLCKKKNEKNL